ncbi:MAG: hypothetical protein JWR05_1173 [Mucilaginibacter sp.]|nr:hypothetical protein [Mucilaginibacter sp.]
MIFFLRLDYKVSNHMFLNVKNNMDSIRKHQ